jgi:hypothetical protein
VVVHLGFWTKKNNLREPRTRLVDHVVLPATGLYDAQASPFGLAHQATLRDLCRRNLGQDHMPVEEDREQRGKTVVFLQSR